MTPDSPTTSETPSGSEPAAPPVRVLLLPGWQDSGTAHWQSRWEALHGFRRVQQDDWLWPRRGDWLARLDEVLLEDSKRVWWERLEKEMSPEQAAQAMLHGWSQGVFDIHFPKRFTAWLKLMRVLPYRWYFALVRRFTGL